MWITVFNALDLTSAASFYTQGDYGLWQCSAPCHHQTYDNEEIVRQMVEAQGFRTTKEGLKVPDGITISMSVPSELIPRCPICGRLISMNLRADNTFVQDAGWYAAAERYDAFIRRHDHQPILYLELGVGMNTPGIIKYPFWQMTYQNPEATYVCINYGDAAAPKEIAERSVCIDGDIGNVLKKLKWKEAGSVSAMDAVY